MICWQRTAPVTSLYAYVTLSQCSPQSMQLSAMRLQLRLLLWTVLLLPALLGRCCAQVDCEKRSSYTNCVSEINGLESKGVKLNCDDSGSEVICKHNTYTCTLYIHTHTHIIHTHVHIKKVNAIWQREEFSRTFGNDNFCMCSHSEYLYIIVSFWFPENRSAVMIKHPEGLYFDPCTPVQP